MYHDRYGLVVKWLTQEFAKLSFAGSIPAQASFALAIP